MEFNFAPIMTWIKYLQLGNWRIINEKKYSENEILTKFNDLFRNELAREGNSNFAFNPYKGIGYMSLSFNSDDGTYFVKDDYGYLTCFYVGICKGIGNKKLGLNKKIHGFYSNYFKFVDKEDEDYVFLTSIINGNCESTPNVIRMINILFLRQQPIYEEFNKKITIFRDYDVAEKEEILRECHKY